VEEIQSNARVIAATNRNLKQMVAAGTFREDLFYRLFNLRIRTPALREHPEDLPDLVLHFWHQLAGKDALPLPADVLRELTTYAWPGNARELRAFLTNLAALADGHAVTVSMVHAVMRDRIGPMPSAWDASPHTLLPRGVGYGG
jgi:DNA-binding NtrC family response regulator